MKFIKVVPTHLGTHRKIFNYQQTENGLRRLFRRIAKIQSDVSQCADADNVNRPTEQKAMSRIYAQQLVRLMQRRGATTEHKDAMMEWASQYLTDGELANAGY